MCEYLLDAARNNRASDGIANARPLSRLARMISTGSRVRAVDDVATLGANIRSELILVVVSTAANPRWNFHDERDDNVRDDIFFPRVGIHDLNSQIIRQIQN